MSLSDHLFGGGVLGGSVVDHLTSQGSLAYEREKGQLIAVNAVSNTITVLAVNGDRLLRRQVLPTLGGGTARWVSTPTRRRSSSPRPARWRSRPKAASCS
jgi:hypothetical protein